MLQVLGRYACEEFAEQFNIPVEEIGTVSCNHKLAIINYTSRRYIDINSGIRQGETAYKHLRAVSVLQEALAAMEPYGGSEYLVRWSDLSPELIEIMRNEGEGALILEDAFTSCSANSEYESGIERQYKVIIKHISGRYIAHLSTHPWEDEVLIPAFTAFEVMNFDEHQKIVYLRELSKAEYDAQLNENTIENEEAQNE